MVKGLQRNLNNIKSYLNLIINQSIKFFHRLAD